MVGPIGIEILVGAWLGFMARVLVMAHEGHAEAVRREDIKEIVATMTRKGRTGPRRSGSCTAAGCGSARRSQSGPAGA